MVHSRHICKYLSLSALLLLLTSVSLQAGVNGKILSDSHNVTTVKIWGTHSERGYAYGYLLADKICDLYNGYIRTHFGENYETAKQLLMDEKNFVIPDEFITEAEAVVSGMRAAGFVEEMDSWDILLSSSFLDVSGLGEKVLSGTGCSSLISWGEATEGTYLDGKSILTRHLDWAAPPAIINNFVVAFHVPSEVDEQPWINIGFAGLISSLSCVNKSGVGAFSHVLIDKAHGQSTEGKGYIPVWCTQRSAIEKLDSNGDGKHDVNDVRYAIERSEYGYADGFIITAVAAASLKDAERIAMIAELAPVEPYCTFRSTDYEDQIPGDNLYSANSEVRRNNSRRYCVRYNRVVDSIDGGTGFDGDAHWKFMKNASNCDELNWANLQVMQYIPEENILKLSVYQNDTHAFEMDPFVVDIKECLSEEGGVR